MRMIVFAFIGDNEHWRILQWSLHMFPGRAIPRTTALVVTPARQQTKAFVSFPHDAQYESVYLMVPSCCHTFLLDWQLHRNSRNTRIHAFSDTNWARLKKNTYLWQIMSNQEWICWHHLEHKITNPNGFLNNHLKCKIINPNRFLNTIFNAKLPTLMDFLTPSWTQNYKPEGIS